MTPEQVLYYSENCFGTADAISFRNNFLRIHDLKTGVVPAHMEQLEIYAALFCLEYRVKPMDISMELRIYQNDDVLISVGLFVNLSDYCIGATKGGQITRFNQFDIDFNQEKYLIETRISGALTRAYSAIALEKLVGGTPSVDNDL